jgi:hypothetical protein
MLLENDLHCFEQKREQLEAVAKVVDIRDALDLVHVRSLCIDVAGVVLGSFVLYVHEGSDIVIHPP